jgi:hypothetical protein
MEISDLRELIDSSHFIDSSLKERCVEYFKQIPEGLGDWFYSPVPVPILLSQGDILDKLDVVYFTIRNDSQEIQIIDESVCMLLSNTCDMNSEGKTRDKYISVAPAFNFEEFASTAKPQNYSETSWQDFLKDVKANRITDILYIPERGSIKAAVVFLDKICSIDPDVLKIRLEKNRAKKLLSLSQIGFYFLLIKLTYHFARFEDRTEVKRE